MPVVPHLSRIDCCAAGIRRDALREGRLRVPPSMSHTITAGESGGFFIEQAMEVFVGGKKLKFETGKIGRTADGSVTLTVGDCVLYSSACADKDPMVRMGSRRGRDHGAAEVHMCCWRTCSGCCGRMWTSRRCAWTISSVSVRRA